MEDSSTDVSIAVLNQNILAVVSDISDIKQHLAKQNGRVFENQKAIHSIETEQERMKTLVDIIRCDYASMRKEQSSTEGRLRDFLEGNVFQIITMIVLILEIAGLI